MEPISVLNWENLKFLIPLIYIIPTFILYFIILFLFFVSKNKTKFNGSFEILFGFSAIHYMLYAILYYFNTRITAAPMFIPFVKSWGTRSFFISFIHTSIWYATMAPHLFNFVLSFNRFTVFVLKIGYQKFWDKYLKFFVIFCITIPILLCFFTPFTDSCIKLNFENEPDGIRYITECHPERVPFMNNPRNTAILMTFTSTFSFFFNCFVIVKLLQRRYCSKNVYYFYSNQDFKMFIYTLLIFIIEVFYCAQQYIFMFPHDQTFMLQMFNIQYYLVDIGTLSPAWFIILTNKKLREQIKMSVFRCRSSTVHASLHTHLNSNHSNISAIVVT